jgi:hypothetical protein
MKFKREKRSSTAVWVVAGVAVAVGAAYAISRLLKSEPVSRRLDSRRLEKRVLQALLDHESTRDYAIEIAAVGTGVIELSGVVETEEEARQVVNLVDRIAGVHAVLNRLEIRTEESRLERNRNRATTPHTTRWYGGTVGIGKRRQSFTTDPARPDDHAALQERALQPNRDDALTDVEEMEDNGVRIGLSRAGAFRTDVAPESPDIESDAPGMPPEIAPHDAAQRQ